MKRGLKGFTVLAQAADGEPGAAPASYYVYAESPDLARKKVESGELGTAAARADWDDLTVVIAVLPGRVPNLLSPQS